MVQGLMLFVTNLLLTIVDLDSHFRTSKFQDKWIISRHFRTVYKISGIKENSGLSSGLK